MNEVKECRCVFITFVEVGTGHVRHQVPVFVAVSAFVAVVFVVMLKLVLGGGATGGAPEL